MPPANPQLMESGDEEVAQPLKEYHRTVHLVNVGWAGGHAIRVRPLDESLLGATAEGKAIDIEVRGIGRQFQLMVAVWTSDHIEHPRRIHNKVAAARIVKEIIALVRLRDRFPVQEHIDLEVATVWAVHHNVHFSPMIPDRNVIAEIRRRSGVH